LLMELTERTGSCDAAASLRQSVTVQILRSV
jgi:hypothetical protein